MKNVAEKSYGRSRHFIGGEWVDGPDTGASFNPASGAVLGEYSLGDQKLAERAIDAAKAAFFGSEWSQSPRLRASVLEQFADRLEARREEFVDRITHENGKTIAEANGEMAISISETRYYAGLARNIFGRMIETAPGNISLLSREPAGVAAIIVPWNAPITLLIRSLAPAMAAGCTSVIKPAPQTPLINQLAVECLEEVSALPKGVVNSVNENGKIVGEALVSSPDVDVISFTGSSQTGKAIMAAAAPTLKKLSLELGGKTPVVVFPDSDLDKATVEITRGSLVMAGQMCVAASRVLAHESIAGELKERLRTAFSRVRVGPGYDPSTQMGPVIDRASQDRLLGMIERAGDEGEMILKGSALDGALASGYFVTPTIFAIDDVDSPLIQEELFGPLVAFEIFSDESEAIERANRSVYGLASAVWTRDLKRATRVSRALRYGTVWLNCHGRLLPEAETGGYRQSGLGRLHGVEGLNDFLETKHVYHESAES